MLWPEFSRTANDVVLDRARRSRHTPSHFSVWLPITVGKLDERKTRTTYNITYGYILCLLEREREKCFI